MSARQHHLGPFGVGFDHRIVVLWLGPLVVHACDHRVNPPLLDEGEGCSRDRFVHLGPWHVGAEARQLQGAAS